MQERILLILDQDFYLAGEPINFYAMEFDAALQIPIQFSSVLYVELYDQENNVVNAKKILLQDGRGINYISIPRQLHTGYYYLRAYTNYMKNFGPGAFFTTKIRVVNPFFKITYSNTKAKNTGEMKLTLVPEGGNILYGIENKIAFYSSKINSRIFARLLENDSVLAEVDTKKGYGVFVFTPDEEKNYRVEAVTATREKTVAEIKDIARSGVICKFDSVNGSVAFLSVVARNFTHYPLILFIRNNGIEYEFADKLYDPESSVKMDLPKGLNHIVVKDSEGNEVTRRLVYIKPEAGFTINASIDKANVSPDDSVLIQINSGMEDTLHYVVALNLGNSSTIPSIQELMESAVYISSIASLNPNITVNELDDMVHTMNNVNDYILKFQESNATNTVRELISFLPEITSDIVGGNIRKQDGEPLGGSKMIYQAFVDSICWINKSITDSMGRFIFTLPFDYQGNDMIVTVKDTTSDYYIKLENEYYPSFLPISRENYYPDSSLKQVIESRMLNLQVDDAFSGMQKGMEAQRPALRFYGYPDAEYLCRDYINLPNLEEFVFEIVREASIVRVRKRVEIRVLSSMTNAIIGNNPLLILDGVPLLNAGGLARIPTEELESVRVVANKFFYGSEIFDGVVDITSNSKSFDLVAMDRNAIRVLFSPVYMPLNNGKEQVSRMPRYTSDVYFKELNTTAGSEKVKVQLPQNTGNYSLSIFGYTDEGEWGSVVLPDAVSVSR